MRELLYKCEPYFQPKHVLLADGYELFWQFVALLTVTGIVSVIFHLVIEAPFAVMWGLVMKLFLPAKKPQKPEAPDDEKNEGVSNPNFNEKQETVSEKSL